MTEIDRRYDPNTDPYDPNPPDPEQIHLLETAPVHFVLKMPLPYKRNYLDWRSIIEGPTPKIPAALKGKCQLVWMGAGEWLVGVATEQDAMLFKLAN